mmetsp:Transcript_47201/g.117797  ORF Transcript_47201/g.117797 Transcript_47201/m.117797 type:complete len:80 (-) Transcript_47201:495-734(-)
MIQSRHAHIGESVVKNSLVPPCTPIHPDRQKQTNTRSRIHSLTDRHISDGRDSSWPSSLPHALTHSHPVRERPVGQLVS